MSVRPPHFCCITVCTDSMPIKFVRTWASLPTRVNAGQVYFELVTPLQNSPTNRVSGPISKAAGLFFAHFPRFMLKRCKRCPISTMLLLFSPIFRVCTHLFDKTDSLYFNPCQTNKNENKTHTCYSNSPHLKKKKNSTERYIRTTYANVYRDYTSIRPAASSSVRLYPKHNMKCWSK